MEINFYEEMGKLILGVVMHLPSYLTWTPSEFFIHSWPCAFLTFQIPSSSPLKLNTSSFKLILPQVGVMLEILTASHALAFYQPLRK